MLMRRLAALALAGVLALVLLAGCGQKPAEQGSSSFQSAQAEAFYSFTDDSGREVSLESQPQRVVAKRLGISRSYISRIEKKALEKLRQQFQQERLL